MSGYWNEAKVTSARGIFSVTIHNVGDRMWHRLSKEEQEVLRAIAQEVLNEELGGLEK